MFDAAHDGLVNPSDVESILKIRQPNDEQNRSETSPVHIDTDQS